MAAIGMRVPNEQHRRRAELLMGPSVGRTPDEEAGGVLRAGLESS